MAGTWASIECLNDRVDTYCKIRTKRENFSSDADYNSELNKHKVEISALCEIPIRNNERGYVVIDNEMLDRVCMTVSLIKCIENNPDKDPSTFIGGLEREDLKEAGYYG